MTSIKHHFHRLLNLIFPPLCFLCREPVEKTGTACPPCWKKLTFIHNPLCTDCGYPLPYSIEPSLCGRCLEAPPLFDQARSILAFKEPIDKAIYDLKFYDRTYLIAYLASWMVQTYHDYLAQADLLIPVPLSKWRLFRRQFNQSGLLAQAISQESKIPVIPNLLEKAKHTPAQSSLSFAERQENLTDAFSLNPKQTVDITGKHIMIIDDVMTTGATLNACATTLRQGGASHVSALTIARTLQEKEI